MKKVTADQINAVVHKHGSGPPVMRLGQMLMDELMPGVACPEVYYEENNITAVCEFSDRFMEDTPDTPS
jgi:hypothetical protein